MKDIGPIEDYFLKFDSQGLDVVKDNIRHGRYREKKLLYAEEWVRIQEEERDAIETVDNRPTHVTNNILVVTEPTFLQKYFSWLPWIDKGRSVEISDTRERRDSKQLHQQPND